MAPPKGSGSGPRPMTAGMAPNRAAQAQSNVSPQEIVNGFVSLFQAFSQVETNQKLKSETESKLSIMVDKLNAGEIGPVTLNKLANLN